MILYTAAHGGFRESVPLGGGAAICNLLVEEWSRTRPFEFRLIHPKVQARDIVHLNERDYARFSREFERFSTEEILKHDPKDTVVLANDVSEGPNFAALRDYRIFTIYHVDVVAYVADIYFRGLIRPETTVKWYRRLHWALPSRRSTCCRGAFPTHLIRATRSRFDMSSMCLIMREFCSR